MRRSRGEDESGDLTDYGPPVAALKSQTSLGKAWQNAPQKEGYNGEEITRKDVLARPLPTASGKSTPPPP